MSSQNHTFEETLANMEELLGQLVSLYNVVAEVVFGRGISTAGSPYLRFYIISISNKHISQVDYRRGWGFRVEIIQHIVAGSERQNEIDLGNAIDKLFLLLESNWDLSSDIIDDTNGTTSEDTRDDGRVVVASFTVTPRSYHSH